MKVFHGFFISVDWVFLLQVPNITFALLQYMVYVCQRNDHLGDADSDKLIWADNLQRLIWMGVQVLLGCHFYRHALQIGHYQLSVPAKGRFYQDWEANGDDLARISLASSSRLQARPKHQRAWYLQWRWKQLSRWQQQEQQTKGNIERCSEKDDF